ncbi:MAG: LysR family transcriptional regulator [Candidatus Bathyarchaeota archaeon]|nr:LysR family transcriptional regulator [Candidatus Bathyarchaeota archaeon]
MLIHNSHKPSAKIWIEYKGEPLLGKGGAKILEAIEHEQSLTKAAKKLGMSYRYVWNYIQKVNEGLGQNVVETYKGGKAGGGGAKLTQTGKDLLGEYKRLEGCLSKFLADTEHVEVKGLKISARNTLKGKVVTVEKGIITGKVKVEIAVPATITSVITKESVEDLDIKEGDEVTVIVKSTEIMIGK